MSLAAENQKLAFWTVRGVRARDRDDVDAAALLGLVEAEAKHDPARGPFAALAVLLARRRAFEEVYRQRRHEERETSLTWVNDEGEDVEKDELPPVPAPDVETPLLVEKLRAALAELPEREAEVLRLRFGLDGEERTLEAVGDVLGLSGARVGQIQRKALARLRRALKGRPEGPSC